MHLPLRSQVNGKRLLGQPDAGVDMQFNFFDLIAHVTNTRRLGAGTIVGSGMLRTVTPRADLPSSERRAIEQLEEGAPRTPFLHFGDWIRIEMEDANGRSVFGAIELWCARKRSNSGNASLLRAAPSRYAARIELAKIYLNIALLLLFCFSRAERDLHHTRTGA